ncbi:MAG: hypothetical protein Q4A90_04540 [Streptococcus sp.]|nr:hypothetical protein [Streptococcus sp.]
MKKKLYKFSKDIGFGYLLSLFIFFFLIKLPIISTFIKNNESLNWFLIFIFHFIITFLYFYKYPFYKLNLANDNTYKMCVLCGRLIIKYIFSIFILTILEKLVLQLHVLSKLEIRLAIILMLIIIGLGLPLYFVYLLININWILYLFLLIMIIPLITIIGWFNIKWWALITSALLIWNFINSKEFWSFLMKGKEIKEVPDELNYKWLKNKLIAYGLTFYIYLILLFSNLFETKDMKILDKANIRITTFGCSMGFVVLIMFLYIAYRVFGVKNKKLNKWTDGLVLKIKNCKKYQFYQKQYSIMKMKYKGEKK